MTTHTLYVLLTLVVTVWTTTTISEPTLDQVDSYKLLNSPALTCPIISLKEIKKILDTVPCNKECIFKNEIHKEFEEKEDELDGKNLVKMFNYVSEEIDFCCNNTKWAPASNKRPSKLEVWLFGLLFVLIICLCSLFGGLIQPLMKKKLFNKLLTTFVGLAYGSLMSSAIFHLLPQALNLIEEDTKHHAYLNICLMIWVGIWVFFMTERLMNIIADIKQKKENSDAHESRINRGATENSLSNSSTPSEIVKLNSRKEQVNSTDTVNVQPIEPIQCIITVEDMQFGHRHSINTVQANANPIATVAWMIIIGDALHNFIDGLSLGAAFNQSILTGFSISVAVIFEELLHELGDVAILLKSGMRMKQALKYNFLSSLTCILGLIVGIFLGEFESSTFIFGFAAGMFIYISLVDMVPKMNEDAHKALQKGTKNAFITLFLQNIGLVIGTSILFGLAKFPNVLMFE